MPAILQPWWIPFPTTGNSQLFAENARHIAWSADNSCIYYVSDVTSNQVFQKPRDLSTLPVLLFKLDTGTGIRLQNLSSDGRFLPFDVASQTERVREIGYFDMVNGKVEMLDHCNTEANERFPAISPDGKWVAYKSSYRGNYAIYVAPFPGPGQTRKVSSQRSVADISFPIWSPDMTALYYLTTYPDYELWRINIQASENNFSFEPAQPIFNGGNIYVRGNDVEIHPDGDRFLVMQRESVSEEAIEPRIKVIVNWEQELEGN